MKLRIDHPAVLAVLSFTLTASALGALHSHGETMAGAEAWPGALETLSRR